MTTQAEPRSHQALAQEALDIQDACNSCGLAQQFAEVMRELFNHPENTGGTSWANQHAITQMWVSKFADLADLELTLAPTAYPEVRKLARGQDIEFEVS